MRDAACGVRNCELQERTKKFAIDIIKWVEQLPMSRATDVMGKQLLRAATSVGANYRAACRAKSRADFISKMGNVEEEADEARYWLESLVEADKVSLNDVQRFLEASDTIVAMTVSSIKTARRNA